MQKNGRALFGGTLVAQEKRSHTSSNCSPANDLLITHSKPQIHKPTIGSVYPVSFLDIYSNPFNQQLSNIFKKDSNIEDKEDNDLKKI